MKLTINKIKVYTTKQDGTPLMTKNNKPYKSVAISVNEEVLGIIGSTIYVNDFGDNTKDWTEGVQVDLDVEKKDINGKIYINGSIPKKGFGEIQTSIDQLFNWVQKLESRVKYLEGELVHLNNEVEIISEEEKEILPF